jgi:hypothetical protein
MDIVSKSWLTTKIKIPVRFPSFWINIKIDRSPTSYFFFCQKCCRCRRRLRFVIVLDYSPSIRTLVRVSSTWFLTYVFIYAHAREWVIFVTWWESQTRYYLRLLIWPTWGDAHTHAPAHPLICDKGFVILLGYITTSESRNVSSPIVRRWCK